MRQLSLLGKLREDPNLPGDWISKPVAVPFCEKMIPFTLRVTATDDVYPPDVENAVRTFLALNEEDRRRVATAVYQHYSTLLKRFPEIDVGITEAADGWQHFQPTNVFVDRYDEGDGHVYVRLTCDCDWDEEHGLQILFWEGNKITLIGEHEDGSFVDRKRG
jgi:hypothetical protein